MIEQNEMKKESALKGRNITAQGTALWLGRSIGNRPMFQSISKRFHSMGRKYELFIFDFNDINITSCVLNLSVK